MFNVRLESLEFSTFSGWLELPLAYSNFQGPKLVRATDALLSSIALALCKICVS